MDQASPAVRGLGLGRRLLAELEAHAADGGARAVRLETNRALQEAIAMYRAAGYREVAAFNDEPYAHHWFEKALDLPAPPPPDPQPGVQPYPQPGTSAPRPQPDRPPDPRPGPSAPGPAGPGNGAV